MRNTLNYIALHKHTPPKLRMHEEHTVTNIWRVEMEIESYSPTDVCVFLKEQIPNISESILETTQ